MNKELKDLVDIIKYEDRFLYRSDEKCMKIAKEMINKIKEIKELAEELVKEYRCKNKFDNLLHL